MTVDNSGIINIAKWQNDIVMYSDNWQKHHIYYLRIDTPVREKL